MNYSNVKKDLFDISINSLVVAIVWASVLMALKSVAGF